MGERDTWKQLNTENYLKTTRLPLSEQQAWPSQMFTEPNIILIIGLNWFIAGGTAGEFLQKLSLMLPFSKHGSNFIAL